MTHASEKTTITYLRDYLPPPWLVDKTRLEIEFFDGFALVKSELRVRRNPLAAKTPLILNGKELETLEVTVNEQVLEKTQYHIDDETLTIEKIPDSCTIGTVVKIYPKQNTALMGIYFASGIYISQCEAQGFRRITWFPDRPDVLSCFDVSLIADKNKYPVLLSNGDPVEKRELDGGRLRVLWRDPHPKPCYLFAVVACNLARLEDEFVTMSGRRIAIHIYTEEQNFPRCRFAMGCLKRAMLWDEENFGLEYDLDLFQMVSTNDFNAGAMENKGLNVYNAKFFLASPETTDDDTFVLIDSYIAHEYFHNYTGNRVTLRDWFQLSLKEGLTSYRKNLYASQFYSKALTRIRAVQIMRAKQFPEDMGPSAHPVRPQSYAAIENFYTATIYNKGAEVLRMLEEIVGRDVFNQSIREYLKQFDGKAATVDDFVGVISRVSGQTLSQFMLWFSQAGTPEVLIEDHYDSKKREFKIKATQHIPPTPGQEKKEPMHIPIAMGLIGQDGLDLPLKLKDTGDDNFQQKTKVLHLRNISQEWTFTDIASKPVPSYGRNFSAPVKIIRNASDEELLFGMEFDGDPFVKWDSAQTLMIKVFERITDSIRQNESPCLDEKFVGAFRHIITDPSLDGSFKAEFMQLPSFAYLESIEKNISLDVWFDSMRLLKKKLSEALHDDLCKIYKGLSSEDNKTPDFTPAAVSRRALRNKSLKWLSWSDEELVSKLAFNLYQNASCFTDRLGAMDALNDMECAEGENILNEFYARFRADENCFPTWFTIQAQADRSDTCEIVKSLECHGSFIFKRPNHVRALHRSFARNYIQFHRKDGAGYKFIADAIIKLDPLNPEVAADLAKHLSSWRLYDEKRQTIIKGELNRILSQPNLSKNTWEIVSKNLA